MGWVHAYERKWASAELAFSRAIELDASLTQAYTSYSIAVLQPQQRFDAALDLLRIAARKHPLSLDVLREIGQIQLFSGQPAAANDTFERVSDLEPEFPFVPEYRARALMFSGRLDEAFSLLAPVQHPYLAYVYVKSGRRGEAERLAEAWERHSYALAVVAAALGDIRLSVEAVNRVAEVEPHRLGRLLIEPELAAVREDPRVRALREDPRVRALRNRFDLP
jgi:predicted Zn-dependent protease